MLNPRFIVINYYTSLHRVECLNEIETLIGRGRSCGIRLQDTHVSRNHARLRKEDDLLTIEDLGSRNGTYVNGQSIRGAVSIRDGDEINIGPFNLKICSSADPASNESSDVDLSTLMPREGFRRFKPELKQLPALTPAQRRILGGLLDGNTEKEIADRLELSHHTVHTHAKAIYKAYCVSTRGELIARHMSLQNNQRHFDHPDVGIS